MPTFAEEDSFLFWQVQETGTVGSPSVADGITTFEVLMDGPVLMACTTRWGGGGAGGEWEDELTTREELEEQGWVEFATGLSDTRYVPDEEPRPFHEYIVFRRDSVAAEVFTYRTEKYRAPLIIRSETVIPAPSTFVGLLSMGAIGLFGWYRRRKIRQSSGRQFGFSGQ